MSIFKEKQSFYYNLKDFALIKDDCLNVLKNVKSKSIDVIFADPPYFLSGGGITCKGGKVASVNKGKWDKKISIQEKYKFNKIWIKACKRVLKDNGTIWISGSMHNIYSVGVVLEELGFKIINNITWQKTNPPPNMSCRMFTHSTETILWAKKNDVKSKHIFNYDLMKKINGNKQMKDVWSFSAAKLSEKKYGRHPTQKPLNLLVRLIQASSNEDDIVLDPFCGSSTTGIACNKLKRKYLGIDTNKEYLDLSIKRIENI